MLSFVRFGTLGELFSQHRKTLLVASGEGGGGSGAAGFFAKSTIVEGIVRACGDNFPEVRRECCLCLEKMMAKR